MNGKELLTWCQLRHHFGQSTYQKKPLIMGILNRTPDSFSDGGVYLNLERAREHAQAMIKFGADIIDLGGESSRPGALKISVDEELSRVIPVIERIRNVSDIAISIDTYKPEVMLEAVKAGASMINDIKALRHEGAIDAAASLNVPICLMHMQGEPQTMQNNPMYPNGIIDEINQFFHQRIEACTMAGIERKHLILDPGFGFGKSVNDNLAMLKRLNVFQQHSLPLLLGTSRKSTIGAILQATVDNRLMGGIATMLYAAMHNLAIVRTHDVEETHQALCMLDAIERV